MRLVQVIVLVEDLDQARRSAEGVGLRVLAGGRHPGRGTANLIVPFGDQYLELLAIVDRAEAEQSPLGRPVLAALRTRGPGPARWSVEDPDIAGTARRLGLPVEERQRRLPEGRMIRWEAVGVDLTWEEPWRCAFMAWPDPADQPGRSPAVHPCGATGFARVEVSVPDTDAVTAWLAGDIPSGVQLEEGGRVGPRQIVLASRSGEIPLG